MSLAAGVQYDDNITNGHSASDVKGDTTLWTSFSGGQLFESGDDHSLTVTGDLAGRVYNQFHGLSNVSFGMTVADRVKLGLGVTAPWIRAYGSAARLEFQSHDRTGSRYQFGLAAGKRLGERLELQCEYRWDKRTGRDAPNDFPGASGAIFDTVGHTISLDGRYTIGDGTLAWLSYARRKGEVTSTALEEDTVVVGWRATGDDPVFGPEAYGYKLMATTHILNAGISQAISTRSSLNFDLQRQVVHAAGGNDYYNSVYQISYLYSY